MGAVNNATHGTGMTVFKESPSSKKKLKGQDLIRKRREVGLIQPQGGRPPNDQAG